MKTLKLQRPFGSTFLLTILFLLLILSILEILTRQPVWQDTLSSPKLGSRHYELGPKWTRLKAFERKFGQVDCIMIGSSMVDLGFNPEVFGAAYTAVNGQPIHCFNFAIDAMVPAASSQLAAILAEEFQPQLLLVGTDARDYAVALDDEANTVILDTPWLQYRSGRFNFSGWLMENAYTYRYWWHLQQLIRFTDEDVLRESEHYYTDSGQTPKDEINLEVNVFFVPHVDEGALAYYHTLLQQYMLLPENSDGLAQILALNNAQTQVILVEMPVPAGYFHFFGDPEADYELFLNHVTQLAQQHQVPFWQTTELALIPENGWRDYTHLNAIGADIFSDWLGQKVGEFSQTEK